MKRIILLVALTMLSLSTMAQERNGFEKNHDKITQFIEKHQNDEHIKIIEIGKTMTKAMAMKLFESKNHESAKLMQSIESIDILAESRELKSNILGEMLALPEECENFELITSIEKKGELSKFYFASHDDSKTCEFLMINRRHNERIMLYITGSFSITDITALSTIGSGIK